MDAKDHGVVLRYGDGPDRCDMLGARDVWEFQADGRSGIGLRTEDGDCGYLRGHFGKRHVRTVKAGSPTNPYPKAS
jgi:hypothetical protein